MKKIVALLSLISFLSCEINPPQLSGIEGVVVDSLGIPAANVKIRMTVEGMEFPSGKILAQDTLRTDKSGKFTYSRELKRATIYFNLDIIPNPIYPFVYKLSESNNYGKYGEQRTLQVRSGEYIKNVTVKYLIRNEIEAYYDGLKNK